MCSVTKKALQLPWRGPRRRAEGLAPGDGPSAKRWSRFQGLGGRAMECRGFVTTQLDCSGRVTTEAVGSEGSATARTILGRSAWPLRQWKPSATCSRPGAVHWESGWGSSRPWEQECSPLRERFAFGHFAPGLGATAAASGLPPRGRSLLLAATRSQKLK
jgi:hypothetical protein